jgi:hypothetical protein
LKKSFIVLILVLLLLSSYAWFVLIQADRQQLADSNQLFSQSLTENLARLQVVSQDHDISLIKKDDYWYVEKPHLFLGNQEFIQKSLKIMQEMVTQHNFPFEDDRYGLNPGKAFLLLEFIDGQQKRLRIGEQEGPAQTIYVKDDDQNHVYVFHNLWGQFIYYFVENYYSQVLPIPGQIVKSVTWMRGQEKLWEVRPESKGLISLFLEGQTHSVEKAQALWFFKNIREFSIEDLRFEQDPQFQASHTLHFSTDKGNIRFEFDEKAENIHIPQFNVFAKVDPYSLKSLRNEIERMITHGQK